MIILNRGKIAEEFTVRYLQNHGYHIIDQNWRTKLCEIDIVARKKNTVYFVEVKYRSTNDQGDGLEYVTSKKLRQIIFASEMWASQNDWDGDMQILAVSVSGKNFQRISMVEIEN